MATQPALFPGWLNGRTPLEVVNGYRFPATAVLEAAGINGVTLTNYLSKTPLEMCSKSSGQGKARQFCLIDAYQISLLARFARLTRKIERIATDLNALLWRDAENAAMEKVSSDPGFMRLPVAERRRRLVAAPMDDEKLRLQFCEDVRHAPALYHHRDDSSPLFLYTDDLVLGLRDGPNPTVYDPLFPDGLIVNATRLLGGVDVTLAQHIWRAETRDV